MHGSDFERRQKLTEKLGAFMSNAMRIINNSDSNQQDLDHLELVLDMLNSKCESPFFMTRSGSLKINSMEYISDNSREKSLQDAGSMDWGPIPSQPKLIMNPIQDSSSNVNSASMNGGMVSYCSPNLKKHVRSFGQFQDLSNFATQNLNGGNRT